MPKFTVEHEVSDQFIGDILTTAVESGYDGIGSWAACSEINRSVEGDGYESLTIMSIKIVDAEHADCNQEHCRFEIPDAPCEPTFAANTVVDHKTIVAGIERILRGSVPLRKDLFDQIARGVAENDADIDAWASECIVQAGLFDQITFS